ncbi:MAG: biopolymer transporter ExbD [Rubellimicrobium sp.]|nr:biopolymer transporter ExbD [Rubellimicrobium sp.]
MTNFPGGERSMRRYRLPLTPMADVMFQLLVFFMLASISVPYSLLPLRSAAAPATAGPGTGQAEDGLSVAAPGTAIWTVEAGALRAGGQRFELDRLPGLVAALANSGTTAVLLITRTDAQVQDLTTVLEALQAGGIASIQLATAGPG